MLDDLGTGPALEWLVGRLAGRSGAAIILDHRTLMRPPAEVELAMYRVAQEAIVKAAQQKATEILTSAQSQSREMRTTVTNYCENMLRHTEEQLAKSMTEVKTVRSTLRQSGKKATVRPAAQPQKPE